MGQGSWRWGISEGWWCGGEALHVLFQGAVIPESIVAFGRKAAVSAIEARGQAVAFGGGVEVQAVGGLMLGLDMSQLPADATAFVFRRAPTLCHVMGEHVTPLALVVLNISLRVFDFTCFAKHVAGRTESPVNFTFSVV